jgi:hypothetical protein
MQLSNGRLAAEVVMAGFSPAISDLMENPSPEYRDTRDKRWHDAGMGNPTPLECGAKCFGFENVPRCGAT